jgi:hypothetical protein
VFLLATPASAIEPSRVQQCWNLQPEHFSIGAKVEMRIKLDANGSVVTADVLRYEPDSEDGRAVAMSAARAAVTCGPYPGESGEFYFTFTPDNSAESSVITLPDNADGTDNSLANEIQQLIDGK